MARKVRKFNLEVAPEALQEDLGKYRQLALELGASDARIISTDLVAIDDRVLFRCMSPMCPYYKTNLNCPPHSFTPDQTRRLVENYENGIFIMLEVPPGEHADRDYYDTKKHRIPGAVKMYRIVAEVQNAAYYDGHPLAAAFGGGPCCKRVFCPTVECNGVKGEGCRFGHKVTPTMHSVGMDVFTMAARVGWDLYPIGKSSEPDEVPCARELGLVLVR